MKSFSIPYLGENIETADVVKVLVKVGDILALDQSALEVETEKVTVEVPSGVAGRVTEILIKEGDRVKVGQVVIHVEESTQDIPAKIEVTTPTPVPAVPVREIPGGHKPSHPHHTYTSPTVRVLAQELGLDINTIAPTGEKGRITKEDVLSAKTSTTAPSPQREKIPVAPLYDFSRWGEITRTPMNAIRRKILSHLTQSWSAPHVTQCEKVDITDLNALLKKKSDDKTKLTVTAVLIKIIATALAQFPQFAASIDNENEEIIFKKYVHIGVAVDTPRGLLVPVIRDVEKKSVITISQELKTLARRARDNKLTLEELQGGVFTITNLGGIGGTHFTPIINAPEVAILGVSRSNIEPVYQKNGTFAPRLMLPLSLSYDHRLIDGADGMRFLVAICLALSEPSKLEF